MVTCYIIDDEFHAVETICKLIRNTPGLEATGHNLSPVAGLEFITTAHRPPDLTFIDVNMIELPGLELAPLINHLTNVIFITGYDKDAIAIFEAEKQDYLLKPISQDRFFKCVSKYLT